MGGKTRRSASSPGVRSVMTGLSLVPVLLLTQSVTATAVCCVVHDTLYLPDLSSGNCEPTRAGAPGVPRCVFTADGVLSIGGVPHNLTDFDCYRPPGGGHAPRRGLRTDDVICLDEPTLPEGGVPRTGGATLRVPSGERLALNAAGFFLSVPFSVATLLAFALVEEMSSLHGSVVVRYMACHVFGCLAMGLADLLVISTASGYLCTATGYALQFFFTSTFFWLNVMCFDIYRTFRGIRNPRTRSKEEIRRKLRRYSVYAWFTPLVILLVTVSVDQYPGITEASLFKPGMGVGRCFFREEKAKWIYFYSPIAVIVLSDIYMFVATAYTIWRQSKEFSRLSTPDSRKHNSAGEVERYSICLKLFLMMGAKWLLELLSSLLYDNSFLWRAVDFANAIEGVFFFSVLVWNRRFRKLAWAKIRCCGSERKPTGNCYFLN